MEQYKDKNGKYSLNPETLFSNRMIYDTIKYQKKYGFEIGKNNSTWNNEADAFKHAFGSAEMFFNIGNLGSLAGGINRIQNQTVHQKGAIHLMANG